MSPNETRLVCAVSAYLAWLKTPPYSHATGQARRKAMQAAIDAYGLEDVDDGTVPLKPWQRAWAEVGFMPLCEYVELQDIVGR